MKRKNQQPLTLGQIREQILAVLTERAPDTLKGNELSKALGIPATSDEHELVREALHALEEEGLIFKAARRQYGRAVPVITVDGRLRMMRQGRWCVIPEDGADCEIEIDGRDLWTAFHGDLVRAKVLTVPRPGEMARGEVMRVLDRANDSVVGTLKKGRHFYIEPDDRKIHRTVTVYKNSVGEAKIGDKVVARMREWTDPYQDPEAVIIERLGRAGDMRAEILSIAAKFRLPHVFPDDVLAEADSFPDVPTEEDLIGRRDLRNSIILTIDPYDARDFDDAISIDEHEDGDVTLGIHIADVSHYVKEGSALDIEAYKRGTSVYLVTGVIPMLPERLSNNLCSLRPDEDRLAYSVFVRLTPRGVIKSYEIAKSVIRSKRRFSYEEALEVLATGEGDYANELLAINKMAHVLRANRRKKGSVDFETTEIKFVLDENSQPVEVLQKRATESTRLIEDCMLLANRIVAEHIGKKQPMSKRGGTSAPFIYRIHDVPPKEKLLDLSSFVKSLGYSLPVENIQPKDIQKLVDWAKGTDEEELINEVTLRSMAKAVYSEFNIGHFGLAFEYYTHFTSPIRRYPDLIVHRMLSEYASGMSNERRLYHDRTLGATAVHCSERERAAVDAERDSVKIAKVQFLKKHVGEVFEASIGGVMAFGIFCELKQFGIEGLVSVRSMRDDYYTFDERAKAFRGRERGRIFRLGDTVFVRVIRVNEIETQIDLELIDRKEFIERGGIPSSEEGPHEHLEVRSRRPIVFERSGSKPGKRPSPSAGSSKRGAAGKATAGKAKRASNPNPAKRKRRG